MWWWTSRLGEREVEFSRLWDAPQEYRLSQLPGAQRWRRARGIGLGEGARGRVGNNVQKARGIAEQVLVVVVYNGYLDGRIAVSGLQRPLRAVAAPGANHQPVRFAGRRAASPGQGGRVAAQAAVSEPERQTVARCFSRQNLLHSGLSLSGQQLCAEPPSRHKSRSAFRGSSPSVAREGSASPWPRITWSTRWWEEL
jgi:hypothetical protein